MTSMSLFVVVPAGLLILGAAAAELRGRGLSTKTGVWTVVAALWIQFVLFGVSGLGVGFLGIALAAVFMVPLAMAGLVGAAELSLTAAFGAFLGWRLLLLGLAAAFAVAALAALVSLFVEGRLAAALGRLLRTIYGLATGQFVLAPATRPVLGLPYALLIVVGVSAALAAELFL